MRLAVLAFALVRLVLLQLALPTLGETASYAFAVDPKQAGVVPMLFPMAMSQSVSPSSC